MDPGIPFRAGTRILHLSSLPVLRLSLLETAIANAVRTNRRFYAIVSSVFAPIIQEALTLLPERVRSGRVATFEEVAPESADPAPLAQAVIAFADQSETTQWRVDDEDVESLFLFDLDPCFAALDSGSRAEEFLDLLGSAERSSRRAMVEMASLSGLPRGLSERFTQVHDEWMIGPGFGRLAAADLDRASTLAALSTPASRAHFAEQASRPSPDLADLLPQVFRDYRRGLLILDNDLTIRHATGRATNLLGREPTELIGATIDHCLDGVDLLAVRREAVSAMPGSPFVVSWRLGAGDYTPREVTVDPITSGNRRVGSVLSVGTIESRRGPRVVYRDMTERPEEGFLDDPEWDDELAESLRESRVTRREHEIMLLLLGKSSNREIARELDIAEVTVKKHLTSLYRKLRIGSRAELMRSFAAPEGS